MHTLARAVIARTREAVFTPEVAVLFHKQTHSLYRSGNGIFCKLSVIVLGKKNAVVVKLLYLFVAGLYILFDVKAGKLLYHSFGTLVLKGRLYVVQHIVGKLVHKMNAAAVCVEDYIQSAQLVLMYHKCTSFYPNHQLKV